MKTKPYQKCGNMIPSRFHGFTILELMITIAVAAILLSLAAPNFSESIKNNRLITKTNDLVVAAAIARQTAISRGLITFICHSNNADTATPTCGGGVDSAWSKGFIIYTVPPRTLVNAKRSYATLTDSLITQTSLNEDDINILDDNLNASDYFAFAANGLLFNDSSVLNEAVQFTVCDNRSNETGRVVRISPAGRVNSATVACS